MSGDVRLAPAPWSRRGAPARILAVGARAWWRHWPALLVILLAGECVREVMIRAAGFAATVDTLWGLLVLPFIVLTRLAAIIAMLLVVRSSMPELSRRRRDAIHTAGSPARFRDVLAGSVLTFFIVYAAWDLIAEDETDYAASYLEQVNFFDLPEGGTGGPFELGLTGVTVGVVVVALVLRLVLHRVARRFPGVAGFVGVYLEAVWIFVAVVVLRSIFEFVPAWIQSRRVVVWLSELRDGLVDQVPVFQVVTEAAEWLLAQSVEAVFLPLMWLALVGIVYVNSLPAADAVAAGPGAPRAGGFVRRRVHDVGDGLLERWRPVAIAGRTIARSGLGTIGFVILLLITIDTATDWTNVAVWRLVAPQELGFWFAADRALSLISLAIWEPIRICALAAAFDTCLQLASRSGDETDAQRLRVEDRQLDLS